MVFPTPLTPTIRLNPGWNRNSPFSIERRLVIFRRVRIISHYKTSVALARRYITCHRFLAAHVQTHVGTIKRGKFPSLVVPKVEFVEPYQDSVFRDVRRGIAPLGPRRLGSQYLQGRFRSVHRHLFIAGPIYLAAIHGRTMPLQFYASSDSGSSEAGTPTCGLPSTHPYATSERPYGPVF